MNQRINFVLLVLVAGSVFVELCLRYPDQYRVQPIAYQENLCAKTNETNARPAATSPATEFSQSSSCSHCITEYIDKMKELGIQNGVSYKEWEETLCLPPANHTSLRPFLIGAGPGTTATRSFALAVNLLGKEVVHYGARLAGDGSRNKENWYAVLKRFRVDDLVRGMESPVEWKDISNTLDFAALYDPLEAIFDWPAPFYATDILRAYPNSVIMMTHRDPAVWYKKRQNFCLDQKNMCDVAFLLRPVNITLRDMTEQQAVRSFEATEKALECLVGPDRYLKVDAWNQPEEGWMPHIANLLAVRNPPQESNCSVPKSTDHVLNCGRADRACQQCRRYMSKQLVRKDTYLLA